MTGFADPPDLAAALADDPHERAACVEALMRWNAPEAATSYMTANGGRDAQDYWLGLREGDRHLYRRRVAAIEGALNA